MHNIALIGIMAAGKSTVGRMVARELEFGFLDTDELIEERAGCSIADIFQRCGEEGFRQFERDLVVEFQSAKGQVIATGGGLVVDRANFEGLKTHCLIVCLWASARKIRERVQRQNHRPLLQGSDQAERIEQLLVERTPIYRRADVLINTDLRSLVEVAHLAVYHFRNLGVSNETRC